MKAKIKFSPRSLLEMLKNKKEGMKHFFKARINSTRLRKDLSHKKKELKTMMDELEQHPGEKQNHVGSIYRNDIETLTHNVAILKYQCHNIEKELDSMHTNH